MDPTDAQSQKPQRAAYCEVNGRLLQLVGSVEIDDAKGHNQSPSKQRQAAHGHQSGCKEPANKANAA